MKKIISIMLVISIFTCISAPAFATSVSLHPIEIVRETYTSASQNGVFYESYSYVDSIGDTYNVSFSKSQEETTAIITDESGNLIAKSEYINGNSFITNTIPVSARSIFPHNAYTENISIDSYVKDDSEFEKSFFIEDSSLVQNPMTVAATTSGGDPVPGSTTYKYYKTYNTDYIYLGEILKGDGYYRKLSGYDEYNRASYAFQKGVTIAAIFTILGGVYSFLTGTVDILTLAGGMGISVIGSAIGMDWNLNACVRSFDFQFQCRMVYNGSTKTMSQIAHQLEYLYGYDEVLETDSYVFDSFSYSSPEQAVSAHCSEAVGYGAAAFNAKYIMGTYPTLVLPVSGPSWEWNW